MKLTLRDQQASTRRLTGLYMTALSVVALLALGGQLLIQYSLAQQSGDSRVINIAGRQRMLSQEVSKAALAIALSASSSDRQSAFTEEQTTLALWERVHHGLQSGDSTLGLPGQNSQTVATQFLALSPHFDTLAQAAHQVLQTVEQQPSLSSAALQTRLAPFLQTILIQEPQYVAGMDAIVLQYQHEAEERVNRSRILELCLLALTLLVLLFEGLLVFRPAVQRLSKSVADLLRAEAKVTSQLKELEEKNLELEEAFAEAIAAHRKVMPHARVVALGQYQIQGSQGQYYEVRSRTVEGTLYLECPCPMYKRSAICSHSLAAASLHSALLRQQQQPFSRFGNNSSAGGLKGELG